MNTSSWMKVRTDHEEEETGDEEEEEEEEEEETSFYWGRISSTMCQRSCFFAPVSKNHINHGFNTRWPHPYTSFCLLYLGEFRRWWRRLVSRTLINYESGIRLSVSRCVTATRSSTARRQQKWRDQITFHVSRQEGEGEEEEEDFEILQQTELLIRRLWFNTSFICYSS